MLIIEEKKALKNLGYSQPAELDFCLKPNKSFFMAQSNSGYPQATIQIAQQTTC